MKKSILFLASALWFSIGTVFAQDVIVKKDGSTILAKVNRVGATEIEYKKWNNLNGPTYTIRVAELLSINYENGEKDIFNGVPAKTRDLDILGYQDDPMKIDKSPSKQNAELINSYRTNVRQIGSPSQKDATYCTVLFGVTSSSIISNEDLEISFSQTEDRYGAETDGDVHSFDIEIRNKTNRTIYIDKGNCFRVINGIDSYCYYNSEKTTITKDDGTGTHSVQRIIAIPANSTKKLCEDKYIKVSMSNWWLNIDPNEDFYTYSNQKSDGTFRNGWGEILASQFGLYKGDLKLGQVLSYNENNTIYRRVYHITYSYTEMFNSYSTIDFTLYIQQVYGYKFYSGKGLENINKGENGRFIRCDNAKLQK